jgi:tRNA(fMet)-specific endonuclease VapC
MFMLDTNICIYSIGGKHPAIGARFVEHWDALCISSITLAELEFGVAKSSRPEANRLGLDKFMGGIPVMRFGPEQTRIYGEVKAQLSRAGTPIGPLDLLIAAHARSLDLTLVTNKRREFDRVPGLKVENWL